MPHLWRTRFTRLKNLGFAFLAGLLAVLIGLVLRDSISTKILVGVGLVALVPGLVYLLMVTMWHWKGRYRGNHSDLWGALLLIEASGWFKLAYLFRHIIPDARQSGR
jgi:hypothetical protein